MFDAQGRKRITLKSRIEVIIDGRSVSTGLLEDGKVYGRDDLLNLPDAVPMRVVAIGDSSLLDKIIVDENISAVDIVDTKTVGENGDNRKILRDNPSV